MIEEIEIRGEREYGRVTKPSFRHKSVRFRQIRLVFLSSKLVRLRGHQRTVPVQTRALRPLRSAAIALQHWLPPRPVQAQQQQQQQQPPVLPG